jgi:hypothetical protein
MRDANHCLVLTPAHKWNPYERRLSSTFIAYCNHYWLDLLTFCCCIRSLSLPFFFSRCTYVWYFVYMSSSPIRRKVNEHVHGLSSTHRKRKRSKVQYWRYKRDEFVRRRWDWFMCATLIKIGIVKWRYMKIYWKEKRIETLADHK